MMNISSRITDLFGIEYPIIQGGMIWCSGWKLAAAVSEAGGLGLLGSGSMRPDQLEEEIRRCRAATDRPFGVNIPLLYPSADEHIQTVIRERIPVVFTSAGNPSKYTAQLKEHGIKVVHVVANLKFALKAQEAGVDAVVGEGFEAGGHNGREETTTLVLMQLLRRHLHIPLIAAGGIGTGSAIHAVMVLGADGVQIGSLFAASEESTGHPAFKRAVVEAIDGSTMLTLKRIVPVRLIRNSFFRRVEEAETRGATREELSDLLGRGRAKLGISDGDTEEGELEIGQISALIGEVKPVRVIMETLVAELEYSLSRLPGGSAGV